MADANPCLYRPAEFREHQNNVHVPQTRSADLAAKLACGVDLFNRGEYFDCHEVWEDVWRLLEGEPRLFMQALIQVAVALHHATHGNPVGARSLLGRAVDRLSLYDRDFAGFDLPALLASLAQWRAALNDGVALPDPPQVRVDVDRMLKSLFP